MLNGNGVAGSAADGAYLLRQRGYVTVLPPGNASPNAPTQGYFHTTIYYDKRQPGSEAAANALSKLIVPSTVGPLPKDPKLRALDPGAMLTVVVGETFHNQLVAPTPTPSAPKHQAPNVRYDALDRARPAEAASSTACRSSSRCRRCSSGPRIPTISTATSRPASTGSTSTHKAIRLVFRTGAGEYWGIEETDMPNPPILADKSFHRAIKGREF